ncbi:hypothetical protein [Emcibacter sp. SYSU 3D8]|uniref:hypothetical protein n=1 Tax=Emcibacter sp. SYSU 3D8 TaxID=3133969 RepID=UPI0031FF356A
MALFLVMTWLYMAGHQTLYASILSNYGILPFKTPFLDIAQPLAAWECTRLGLDVIETTYCDPLLRPTNYPPIWISLSWIPLDAADTAIVGWFMGLAFVLTLFALPAARSASNAATMALACTSTMVVFGVERANIDISLFTLCAAAAWLLLGRPIWRGAGYALFLAGAALKYYPIVLVVMAARERLRVFVAIALVSAILVLAFFLTYHDEIWRGARFIPAGLTPDIFGAKNILLAADLVSETVFAGSDSAMLLLRIAAALIYVLLAISLIATVAHTMRNPAFADGMKSLAPSEHVFLAVGSILMVACFFVVQNVGYRGIFLLFTLPGLMAMGREAGDDKLRRVFNAAVWAILFLMWSDGLRTQLVHLLAALDVSLLIRMVAIAGFWLVRELVWWWVIAQLCAVAARFLLASPITPSIRALVKPKR